MVNFKDLPREHFIKTTFECRFCPTWLVPFAFSSSSCCHPKVRACILIWVKNPQRQKKEREKQKQIVFLMMNVCKCCLLFLLTFPLIIIFIFIFIAFVCCGSCGQKLAGVFRIQTDRQTHTHKDIETTVITIKTYENSWTWWRNFCPLDFRVPKYFFREEKKEITRGKKGRCYKVIRALH